MANVKPILDLLRSVGQGVMETASKTAPEISKRMLGRTAREVLPRAYSHLPIRPTFTASDLTRVQTAAEFGQFMDRIIRQMTPLQDPVNELARVEELLLAHPMTVAPSLPSSMSEVRDLDLAEGIARFPAVLTAYHANRTFAERAFEAARQRLAQTRAQGGSIDEATSALVVKGLRAIDRKQRVEGALLAFRDSVRRTPHELAPVRDLRILYRDLTTLTLDSIAGRETRPLQARVLDRLDQVVSEGVTPSVRRGRATGELRAREIHDPLLGDLVTNLLEGGVRSGALRITPEDLTRASLRYYTTAQATRRGLEAIHTASYQLRVEDLPLRDRLEGGVRHTEDGFIDLDTINELVNTHAFGNHPSFEQAADDEHLFRLAAEISSLPVEDAARFEDALRATPALREALLVLDDARNIPRHGLPRTEAKRLDKLLRRAEELLASERAGVREEPKITAATERLAREIAEVTDDDVPETPAAIINLLRTANVDSTLKRSLTSSQRSRLTRAARALRPTAKGIDVELADIRAQVERIAQSIDTTVYRDPRVLTPHLAGKANFRLVDAEGHVVEANLLDTMMSAARLKGFKLTVTGTRRNDAGSALAAQTALGLTEATRKQQAQVLEKAAALGSEFGAMFTVLRPRGRPVHFVDARAALAFINNAINDQLQTTSLRVRAVRQIERLAKANKLPADEALLVRAIQGTGHELRDVADEARGLLRDPAVQARVLAMVRRHEVDIFRRTMKPTMPHLRRLSADEVARTVERGQAAAAEIPESLRAMGDLTPTERAFLLQELDQLITDYSAHFERFGGC